MTSDLFSPILIKELRQGLRARGFEGAFMLVQAFMFIIMAMAMAAVKAGDGHTADVLGQGFFWFVIAVPLLLIMPMRGCQAIRSEVENQGLELMFLTRLSARRIVAGKWAALVCQSGLLVCSILPYAVLRYYLGRVDVITDLQAIGGMLALSALLTAVTVSVSTFDSRIARSMIFVYPLMALFVVPTLAGTLFGVFRGAGVLSGGSVLRATLVIGCLVYLAIGTVYFLEIGASRIAPPAENLVIVRRLLGVATWILGWMGLWLGVDESILWIHFGLLAPFWLDAACSPYAVRPGVVLPFVPAGWIGRMLSWFAQPGWPSGTLYSLALIGLSSIGLYLHFGLEPHAVLMWLTFLYTLLAPLAMVVLWAPHSERFAASYLWVHAAFGLLSMALFALDRMFGLPLGSAYAFLPFGSLLLTIQEEQGRGWLPIAAAMLMIVLGLIAVRLAVALPAMHRAWHEAVLLHQRRNALRAEPQITDG